MVPFSMLPSQCTGPGAEFGGQLEQHLLHVVIRKFVCHLQQAQSSRA
jgi:hypothetical protein